MTHGAAPCHPLAPTSCPPAQEGRAFMSLWDSEWTGDPWPVQRLLGGGEALNILGSQGSRSPESVLLRPGRRGHRAGGRPLLLGPRPSPGLPGAAAVPGCRGSLALPWGLFQELRRGIWLK